MSLPASERKERKMPREKFKVIIKRPDEEYGHMTWISTKLENLQKTVGGYIETITIGKIVIICNEEGKLLNLEPNIPLGNADYLCGNIIVCGIKDDEFDDVPISLPEWKAMLKEGF